MDVAYKLAMKAPGLEGDSDVDAIAGHLTRDQPVLLPVGVGDRLQVDDAVKVCDSCPVRSRCRQRSFEAD